MRPHDRYKLRPQSSSLNISFFLLLLCERTCGQFAYRWYYWWWGFLCGHRILHLRRPPQMNNDIAKGKRKCRLIRTKCVHELWADWPFYFVTQIIIMCNVMCVQEEDWTASNSSFFSQILKDRYTLLCALMMTTKTIIVKAPKKFFFFYCSVPWMGI